MTWLSGWLLWLALAAVIVALIPNDKVGVK